MFIEVFCHSIFHVDLCRAFQVILRDVCTIKVSTVARKISRSSSKNYVGLFVTVNGTVLDIGASAI